MGILRFLGILRGGNKSISTCSTLNDCAISVATCRSVLADNLTGKDSYRMKRCVQTL